MSASIGLSWNANASSLLASSGMYSEMAFASEIAFGLATIVAVAFMASIMTTILLGRRDRGSRLSSGNQHPLPHSANLQLETTSKSSSGSRDSQVESAPTRIGSGRTTIIPRSNHLRPASSSNLATSSVRVEVASVNSKTPVPLALESNKVESGFRSLFDSNPNPMWAVDQETSKFVAVNNAAVFKYGYTREEILSLSIRDVCQEDDIGIFSNSSVDNLVPWRHRTKAGVLLDTEASIRPCHFNDRPAFLIIVGDGVDRRRTAAALREREELLRNIITHIPCGVFWKDRASIYLGCNEQVARDVGLGVPGEVVGLTDFELVSLADEAEISRVSDRQVMETGQPLLNVEENRTLTDGDRLTLLTSRVPLREAGGKPVGVLGVYLDITERKKLEEHYRQAAKMEAVGQLAGGIAHDFNNLLTVIRGNAELLLSSASSVPGAVRMVDEVRQAADRAASLVRQLLTFSRPHVANPCVVDLNEVVSDLSSILRRLLGGLVTIDVMTSPTPVPVLADRSQLEQVVMNLAVNARDAMPDGGRISLTVGWSYAPSGPAARIARLSVSDTGSGMSDEVKKRIFDPFFTTKGPDKGTGLGLAVVHGIVKQAGGSISVVSAIGKGTTFHIELPLSDQLPSASKVIVSRRRTREPIVGGGRTVLLVEDEDGIRTLARLTLEGRGFKVTEAPDGAAALAILDGGLTFDLVVTDMTMPEVGGQQVASRAVAEDPRVRVVYMSGYVPDDGRLGEPPGAVFLPKPFTPGDLIRAVEDALAKTEAKSSSNHHAEANT